MINKLISFFKPKFRISEEVRKHIHDICVVAFDPFIDVIIEDNLIKVGPKHGRCRAIKESSDQPIRDLKFITDDEEFSEEEMPEHILKYVENYFQEIIYKIKKEDELKNKKRLSILNSL